MQTVFIMKKNFYLDVVIFLACLVCVVTGIHLDFHLFSGREQKMLFTEIHRWNGYIFAVGLLVHLPHGATSRWISACARYHSSLCTQPSERFRAKFPCSM